MQRRLVIYLKGVSKPIVLSDDSDDNEEELQDKLTKLLSSHDLVTIKTSNDKLLVHPNDIGGILVSNVNTKEYVKDDNKSKTEKPSKKVGKKDSKDKYVPEIVIEGLDD